MGLKGFLILLKQKYKGYYQRRHTVITAQITLSSPNEVLKDRNIVVTGGSRGLGFFLAKKCIDEGANVLLTARNEDCLKESASRLGERCKYSRLDMSDASSFSRFFEKAEAILGCDKIDSVIGNAGMTIIENSFLNVTEESWNKQIDLNLKGNYFFIQEFVKYLLRKPDTKGLNYWVNKLSSGKSRNDILAGFVDSKEFQDLCASYGVKAGSISSGPDTVESTAESVYQYITKTLGYSKPVACGMMANMYHESHFMPTVGNYYYGICQWGGGRRSNLFTWCEANGYDPNTVKGQLHFMNHELTTSYVNTYNQLQQVANSAEGAGEACNIFLHGFEGASVYDGRYELAISYYNQMP